MQKNSAHMATRTLAYCALLAALSVVLARLIIPMPDATTRFSIEAVPIYLAGLLFGPVPGMLVGFSADSIGCLFSGYGYNPLFCVPPILYGLCGGLFSAFVRRSTSPLRLALGLLPAIVLGSVLYQSVALAWVYNPSQFWLEVGIKLTARSIQFAVTWVIDTLVLFLLFRAGIFSRLNLWPKANKER